jgi:hypothetical protein
MKKLLVVGIIALFIGLAVIPSYNAVSISKDIEETNPVIDEVENDCIECQSNGSLCTLYLFLRTRGYFVLLRLEYYAAVLYVMGLYDLLDIFVDYIIYPQYEKLWYYEEKLVEYDCGVPPLPI